MIPSFEVTVPPLRSGAKIGSLLTNFQAFCSYYFHFGPNSLSGWEILFGFWPRELQREAKRVSRGISAPPAAANIISQSGNEMPGATDGRTNIGRAGKIAEHRALEYLLLQLYFPTCLLRVSLGFS